MADAMIEVAITRGRESYRDLLGRLWQTIFEPGRIVRQMEDLFLAAIAAHPSGRVEQTGSAGDPGSQS
jgi:hypothetical protein